MKKPFLALALLATALGVSASTTWRFGNNSATVDTVYHVTVGPGMTSTAVTVNGKNTAGTTISTKVFYTTVDLTNEYVDIRGAVGKDGSARQTVKAMAETQDAKGNGQYISGINADFFNMSKTTPQINGLTYINSPYYQSAPSDDWWRNNAPNLLMMGKGDIHILRGMTAGGQYNEVIFPDESSHLAKNNAGRGQDDLCLYYRTSGYETTHTNQYGVECQVELVSGSFAGHNATYKVISDLQTAGNMAIPTGEAFVLSGHGTSAQLMREQLHPGSTIVIHNAKQVISGWPLIVTDGAISSSENWTNDILNCCSGSSRSARTALGYNTDRTKMVMAVADYYSSGSSGYTVKDMAWTMIALGCHTAMEFDGGGSSQLYSRTLGLLNKPYGSTTSIRAVANGVFAVSTAPVDNQIAQLEVVQKNVKLNNGQSFTPTVYGYNKYGVLINKNVTGFTFKVTSKLGTVSGRTFTAKGTAGSTHGIVSYGNARCAVRILTNGGGQFYNSGDNTASLEVGVVPDIAQTETTFLTEEWSFFTPNIKDEGWDCTSNNNWANQPNWDNPNSIKNKSYIRFATALNDKLYTVDMKTMSIAEIMPDGRLERRYDLPSLKNRTIAYEYNADKTVKKRGIDYYGAAISHDDAGNFIIGHGFLMPSSFCTVTVYSPLENKAKTFDLPLTNHTPGRIDNFGRAVGDVTRNGYLVIAPKATGAEATQQANIIHFTGNGTVDGISASNTNRTVWLAGSDNTLSICQPGYSTIDELMSAPYNAFWCYSKAGSGGVPQWGVDLFYFGVGNTSSSDNKALDWDNYSKLNGFDTFVLQGKRYFVVSYCDKATFAPVYKTVNGSYVDANGAVLSDQNDESLRVIDSHAPGSLQWIIIKDENGTTIAEYKNENYSSDLGYMTISAEVVSENTANIYLFNLTGACKYDGTDYPGGAVGTKLRFSLVRSDTTLDCDVNFYDQSDNSQQFSGMVDDGNDNDGATFTMTGAPNAIVNNGSMRLGNETATIWPHMGYKFKDVRIQSVPCSQLTVNGTSYYVPAHGYIDVKNVTPDNFTLRATSRIHKISFNLDIIENFASIPGNEHKFPTLVGMSSSSIPTNFIAINTDGHRTANHIHLVDGKDFSFTNDVDAEKVTIDRNFGANLVGNWQALYLPYELTEWKKFAEKVITCTGAEEDANGKISLIYEEVPDYDENANNNNAEHGVVNPDDLLEEEGGADNGGQQTGGNQGGQEDNQDDTETGEGMNDNQRLGVLSANTLYIFKPLEGCDFGENAATVHATTSGATEQHFVTDNFNITLGGTFANKTDMWSTGAYGLSGGQFKKAADSSVTLKPFRIYLLVEPKSGNPAPQAVDIVVRGEGSGTTGIDDIISDENADADEAVYYNLMGQRVANPAAGLYIVNGEKKIIK